MWVEFTELDGLPVPVNLDNMEFARPRPKKTDDYWSPGANAELQFTSGHSVKVRETIDQVKAAIRKAQAQ